MGGYSDIETYIGQLKRAAIDAYMVEQEFSIRADDTYYAEISIPIYETDAYGHITITGFVNSSYSISRPGKDGEGPVIYKWLGDRAFPASQSDIEQNEERYRNLFDSIRVAITDTLAGYDSIPNPDVFDGIISTFKNVVSQLSTPNFRSFASGSDFSSHFSAATKSFGYLTGKMVSSYFTLFSRLQIVVPNLGDLAGSLCATASGEKELLSEARDDVFNIVSDSIDALDGYAQSISLLPRHVDKLLLS